MQGENFLPRPAFLPPKATFSFQFYHLYCCLLIFVPSFPSCLSPTFFALARFLPLSFLSFSTRHFASQESPNLFRLS